MKSIGLSLLLFLLSILPIKGQDCNCESNFEWLKQTFEANDAGAQFVITKKGQTAYEVHNQLFMERVKLAKDRNKCALVLKEWLRFFRSGHIDVQIISDSLQISTKPITTSYSDWETLNVNIPTFKQYLSNKTETDFEGIWYGKPYTIGIKKVDNQYLGFIIESDVETWTKGQVKLKITKNNNGFQSVFYMRDHSEKPSHLIKLVGNNHLLVSEVVFTRLYPELEEKKQITDYFKSLTTSTAYLEELNPTTLYLRIPSFSHEYKKDIDNLIATNREKILHTENLIIDIRDNKGGSDGSWEALQPLLYTNTVRTRACKFLSTEFNIQRMLDFYSVESFNKDIHAWAKSTTDLLSKHIGEFVNLWEDDFFIIQYDTVYEYPKNVGILINKKVASSAEQFSLFAKQSRKTKLFGTLTAGVLNMSNLCVAKSPGNEFALIYALSQDIGIEEFPIDEIGIQPDFFLDKNVPEYEWVEYVNGVLNGK